MKPALETSAQPSVATADAVAELDGVTRVYRMGATDVRALDGLDFRVLRGSSW
ncbi:MAG: hypothetical protein ABL998_22015 [Planctomycetota bacterium]